MGLREHIYSVLVVSASEKASSSLTSLLPEHRFSPVHLVKSISAAQRAWSECAYDLVIVNTPLPDGAGSRFAIDISNSSEAVVLMLARADVLGELSEKLTDHGVYTLEKPTSEAALLQSLAWMASTRERLRRLGKKAISFEEKMAEIRLVNRAKWVLISEHGMSEPEAHRFIEKQAMDRGITKAKLAGEIVASGR